MKNPILLFICFIGCINVNAQNNKAFTGCIEYNNSCYMYKIYSTKTGALVIETAYHTLTFNNLSKGENIINNSNFLLANNKQPACTIQCKKGYKYNGYITGSIFYNKAEMNGLLKLLDSSGAKPPFANVNLKIPLE